MVGGASSARAHKAGPAASPAATALRRRGRGLAGVGRPAGPDPQVCPGCGEARRAMTVLGRVIVAVVNSWRAGMRAWPDPREVGREPNGLPGVYRRKRRRLSKCGWSRSPGRKILRGQLERRVSWRIRDVGGGLGGDYSDESRPHRDESPQLVAGDLQLPCQLPVKLAWIPVLSKRKISDNKDVKRHLATFIKKHKQLSRFFLFSSVVFCTKLKRTRKSRKFLDSATRGRQQSH